MNALMFVLGLFIGGIAGVFATALAVAAKDGDDLS